MFLCLVRDSLSPSIAGVLESVARACSPRVEPHSDDVVMCDARGLTRVIGEPDVIAGEMRRMAWERGVGVRIAMAGTQTAAWLLAHVRPGTTVVPAGDEAKVLARLPLTALLMLPECQALEVRAAGRTTRHAKARAAQVQLMRDVLATLDRWGMATLGDLARLPRADITSRLGLAGARLHQAAWGEDEVPLVPVNEAPRFIERVELEWPVEGLEPLSFVLARACEALSGALERADRGAVSIVTRLTLVNKSVHERTLTLPAPMRDAKVLRTLILLDLEAHPPQGDPEHGYGAGIDVVELELGVTPGRIIQKSLLAHDVPAVEDAATLVARLQALMGELRVGSPVVLNTHDSRKSSLKPFVAPAPARAHQSTHAPAHGSTGAPEHSTAAIRRFRIPMPVRVVTDHGVPVRVVLSERSTGAKGLITHCAGPWRTSGQWWSADRDTWDRDEWDVGVDSGVIYRLARDRSTDRWEVEGVLD
jgi:protein ImuB